MTASSPIYAGFGGDISEIRLCSTLSVAVLVLSVVEVTSVVDDVFSSFSVVNLAVVVTVVVVVIVLAVVVVVVKLALAGLWVVATLELNLQTGAGVAERSSSQGGLGLFVVVLEDCGTHV